MRYAATHKQATRERLLDSSRAIAKRRGFDGSGVDALMQAVGLSGGAFYSHFGSKAELFATLVERELEHSAALLGQAAGPPPAGRTAAAARSQLARSLKRYLSHAHAQQPEAGCALPALGAEIARAGPAVRTGVEQSLRQLQQQWAGALAGDGDTAWALLSQCVGALMLARVVQSDRTRHEILAANRRVALAAAAGPGDAASSPA
ncbi:TetR/AcrR family transcriptional regulator [Aquabacterium sp. OR-4]|uniref:TetR/AcrR family transcriptional regulator n=1 Tax=Aquabacterium sp. OR-4 TaxID=2978127 RepID=UPI0021B42046|nr:TetR/AcrR family transcriptional regulator [Aquabacterium sp. OR-4]MDT7835704.1 TetR/AcrR family transcriptional regulator [Aquabacterium sp. OR-4]